MYKNFKPKCVRVNIKVSNFPPKIIQSSLLVIKDGNVLHPQFRQHNAELVMKLTEESYLNVHPKIGYQFILDFKYSLLSSDAIVN